MTSLADQIAKFTNPVPEILDPEDDINVETTAKLCEKASDNNLLIDQVSTLRSRNAPLLDEIDQRYAGKRIPRKDLDDFVEDDDSASEDDEIDRGEYGESDDSDDDDELAIESFKSQIQDKLVDKSDVLSDDNLEVSDVESESEDHEATGDDDGEEEDDVEEGEDDEDEEDDDDDDMVQKFSNIDVTSEIEKGKAVTTQQEFWSRLCECRIKLQKLLLATNKLPQFDTWNIFKRTSDSSYSENLKKGHKSVKMLLNHLLDLQTELISSDPEMASFVKDGGSIDLCIKTNDDEEIPSDSEEDMINTEKSPQVEKPCKRKMKDEEYDAFLAKRHKSLTPFRNSVIQKWDEKTRLSTGRTTHKSFNAFDQSALKQIEQILQDKNRLIKRTRLKRSIYRVLGKDKQEISEKMSEESKEKTSHDLLKDYDAEIFDDDDFYRQMLKDIIENKSAGIDPAILNKQQEIQRIRSKMRRKVDTKASKGRKIRYDVHQKLVNFMAPVITCSMSDCARDELFRSVFGQCGLTIGS